MSNTTPNLGLFKYDIEQDANTPFSITTALNNNWDIIDEKCNGGGLEVCDISTALFVDETKGLRRYLNGQIVDRNANTEAFFDRLKQIQTTNPDYFATEDNWQAEALLNVDGCVYKFVLNYADDGETVISVRLPKYPDYVEVSAGDVAVKGNGMTMGFYGVSRTMGLQARNDAVYFTNDGYGKPVNSQTYAQGSINTGRLAGLTTDPTKSGIVGTLTQTKLKLRYFIQIATGSETENNIVNEIELNNPYVFGKSEYSKTPKDNLSWLASHGQWNPKGTYPSYYNWILENVNNSVEGFKLSTAEDITDYDWVINTADETFRLPFRNGTEGMFGNMSVKGNGNAFGLTSHKGEQIVLSQGLIATTSWGLKGGVVNLPAALNSSNSTINDDRNTLGVITDPTKSGIVTDSSSAIVPDGWKLYYYVGETVQNANLIDAGRIGESLTNKVDLSNTKWATSACMPDYSAGVNYPYSDTSVKQAPTDGIIIAKIGHSTSYSIPGIYVGYTKDKVDIEIGCLRQTMNTAWIVADQTASIPKGIYYKVICITANEGYTFYPLKGAN